MSAALSEEKLVMLRALAARFSTADSALAELSSLQACLSLPKGTVHVVSDVHGEYKKLRHIINNASGTLRPLVQTLFAGRLSDSELRDLLALLYYPREAMDYFSLRLTDETARRAWI